MDQLGLSSCFVLPSVLVHKCKDKTLALRTGITMDVNHSSYKYKITVDINHISYQCKITVYINHVVINV